MNDNTFTARFERMYRAEYKGADPSGFTPLDFVGALGSIGVALLYSRLFFPDFVEVDGMVFLKDLAEDSGGIETIRKMRTELGSAKAVEQNINNFDVNLSFPNHPAQNAEGDDLFLAKQLSEIWSLQLRQLYHHRRFRFEVCEDNGSPCVSFFQEN